MSDSSSILQALMTIKKLIQACEDISSTAQRERNKTILNELHCKQQEIYAKLDSQVAILKNELCNKRDNKEFVLNKTFEILDYALEKCDDQKVKRILHEIDKI